MSLQITLVRHGKADKTLPNHREHPLSDEGKAQARNRRESLGNPAYDLILHSILKRTRETAHLIAGTDECTTNTIRIPGLFFEENDPREEAVERAFEKLGHSALGVYFIDVEAEITSLAEQAKEAIFREVRSIGASNVLVVGHDLLIPALCRAITRKDEPFMSFRCEECEGFRMTIDDTGQVTSVEMFKQQGQWVVNPR